MAEDKTPLDQILDLIIYAPFGFALAARDELPHFIERGKTQLTAQLAMARVFGEFAVTASQQEVKRRAGTLAGQASGAASRLGGSLTEAVGIAGASKSRQVGTASSNGSSPTQTGGASGATASAATATPRTTTRRRDKPATVAARPARRPAARPARTRAPAVSSLAIPGYDSLAASQVVQRLPGLSQRELEAVRRYESATRSRRTILSRVGQLQAP